MGRIIRNNLYMLKFIKKYCMDHIGLVILNALLQNLSVIVNIVIIKKIIDFATGKQNIYSVFNLIFVMFIVDILYLLFNNWFILKKTPLNVEKLHLGMQLEVFSKAASVEYEEFESKEFYDQYILALEQSDSRALEVLKTFSNFIGSLFGISAFLTLVGTFEPFILCIVIVNVIIMFIFNTLISRQQKKFYDTKIPIQRETDYIQEVFYHQSYAKEIRLFSMLKEILINNYRTAIQRKMKIISKYGQKLGILQSFQGIGSEISSTSILMFLSYKAIVGTLSISEFVMLSNSTQQLTMSISQLIRVFIELYEHNLYIESFKIFMKYSCVNKANEKPVSKHPSIYFNNVNFKYPKTDKYVLEKFDLFIPYGKKIALVGENGAGKSTILKLIVKLYSPTNGEILCIDEDNKCEQETSISMIFQDYMMYSFSIAENILMRPLNTYNREEDEELVVQTLKFIGLYDKVISLPEGIYTKITREFTNQGNYFSGGELQRIALGRIYVNKSNIIILDEPSSSLDQKSENDLATNILNLYRDKTIIISSHKPSLLKKMDIIYYIENGCIVEWGSPYEIMKKNGKYSQLFHNEK